LNVVCYTLQLSVINYQTAILRQDLEAAEKLLPSIPTEARERCPREPSCSFHLQISFRFVSVL
jgi:coatomer subunit beta'